MPNAAKIEQVQELNEKFSRAGAAYLAGFRGMNVQKMTELRQTLRQAGSEMLVVKNTLARRAVQGTAFENIASRFTGPTSVIFSYGDPVATAKAIAEFERREPLLVVTGGILEGRVLEADRVKAVAELPPREVLLARMLAGMQAPASGLVGALGGVVRKLLNAMEAIKNKKSMSA